MNVLDALLLVQEALGGGADRVLGAADLDDRDALQVARMPCLLTAPRISTWMRRLDRSSDVQLLHDRQHEDATRP